MRITMIGSSSVDLASGAGFADFLRPSRSLSAGGA